MKKLTVFIGFVMALTQANANVRNVLLEVKASDIAQFHHRLAGPKEMVRVFEDGEVRGYRCDGERFLNGKMVPICNDGYPLDMLPQSEVQKVKAMISEAVGGVERNIPSFCEAIPSQAIHYSANNGSVLLVSGSYPCGGEIKNMAPTTNRLVEMLRNYREYLHSVKGFFPMDIE